MTAQPLGLGSRQIFIPPMPYSPAQPEMAPAVMAIGSELNEGNASVLAATAGVTAAGSTSQWLPRGLPLIMIDRGT